MNDANRHLPHYRQVSGAALLALCLLALVGGVIGAVYLQRGKAPEPAAVAAGLSAPQPAPALAPAATSALNGNKAAPWPPGSTASSAGALAPQTATSQPTAPAPAEAKPALTPGEAAHALAQIAPIAAPAGSEPPAPAAIATPPRYWVEFGAYESAYYADILRQKLKDIGITASITTAPGRHRRRYLRVRLTGTTERASAQAIRAKAAQSLAIRPLLHRAAPARAPAKEIARKSGGYWVQFGAYRSKSAAERVAESLRRHNIPVSVIERRRPQPPIFLIRATSLSSHARAETLAKRGKAALHSRDVLIAARLPGTGLPARAPPR